MKSAENNFYSLQTITQYIKETQASLLTLTTTEILTRYREFVDAKILDPILIKDIRTELFSRNDLRTKELISLLRLTYESSEIKTLDDRYATEAIVSLLMNSEFNYNSLNLLVDAFWILAKMEYHNEYFFLKWKDNLLPLITSLNDVQITKSIQSIAVLNFLDRDILQGLVNRVSEILSQSDTKTKANLIHYLSMISVNNFEKTSSDPLKIQIHETINEIFSIINSHEVSTDTSLITKILYSHCAGIINLLESKFNSYTSKMQKNQNLHTSKIQKEVSEWIKGAYPYFEVAEEVFDPKTSRFIDIYIATKDGLILYVEVDGPDHHFINKDLPNARTLYRDNIYKIHHEYPIIKVNYKDVDYKKYYSKLLEDINTAIVHFRENQLNSLADSKTSNELDIETSNIEEKPSSELTIKPKKHKKKKIIEPKNNELHPDSIEYKYKVLEANLKSENSEFKKKGVYLPKLIPFLLNENRLEDLKLTLEFYSKTNADALNSYFSSCNLESILSITLKHLRYNSEEENIINLEKYSLLLSYGYKPNFHMLHLKSALLSVKYGRVDLFDNYLKLIPDGSNKNELIKILFVANGDLGCIELLDYFIEKHYIDINTHCKTCAVTLIYTFFETPEEQTKRILEVLFNVLQGIEVQHNNIKMKNIHDFIRSFVRLEPNGDKVETPLRMAMESKKINLEFVEKLLESGAREVFTPEKETTDLIKALITQNPEIANLILSYQTTNPDFGDYNGLKALHIAVSNGYIYTAERLIFYGANINGRIVPPHDLVETTQNTDQDRKEIHQAYPDATPLSLAILFKNDLMAEMLVSEGADLYCSVTIGNKKMTIQEISSYVDAELFNKLTYIKNELTDIKTNNDKLLLCIDHDSSNAINKIISQFLDFFTQESKMLQELSDRWIKKFLYREEISKYETIKEQYGIETTGNSAFRQVLAKLHTDKNLVTTEDFKSVNNLFGIDLNWQYKQVIYAEEIKEFLEILRRNNIDKSVNVNILRDNSNSNSNLKKSILFKLHPDKGGNTKDFTFVQGLREKLNKDLDIKEIIDEKLQYIQFIIHKASIGFKTLDAVTDTVRIFNEPNYANTKKIAFDFSYLYGMYSGLNAYSLALSGADGLYQCYQGEYEQALKQAATTAGYMALPAMLSFTGIPYLGFAYGSLIAGYTGYYAINNAYSLYSEYGTVEWQLKSAVAYKGLYEILANSPLQYTYNFASNAKWYDIKANIIKLEMEKTQIKQQLEAKGEFGEKLYEYIHAPMLEEKYNLLNKIISGELTKEQAIALKAKHIKITNQVYQNCMEIKNIENENNAEQYYCYSEEQKIFDHVAITDDNLIKIIGSLEFIMSGVIVLFI